MPDVERSQVLVDRIWRDVLGAGSVPVDADLLELGGDSLTATWIAARIQEAFPESTLTGRDVLVDLPTVAALATNLGPILPPLQLSHPQEALLGIAESYRSKGRPMRAFNVSTAVELRGTLDVAALRTALEHLVQRQAALRVSYHRDQAWRAELNPAPRPFPLPVVDLRVLPAAERAAEVTRRLVDAANTAFAAGEPVRLRAQLLRTADLEHVLGIVLDHLVGDAHSINALYADLGRRYAELTGAGGPVRKRPTYAFFDFVATQREAGSGPALAEGLAFWREVLGADGVHADISLPFERAVPADSPRVARTVRTTLQPEFLIRLDEAAKQTRSTRFRLVLSALYVVLHRISGSDRLSILCPDANRDQPVTRDVIGSFAHLILYRADLSGDPTLAEVIDRVRNTFLGAQAHKQLSYHHLHHALSPDTFGLIRDTTWVHLVAAEVEALDLPGLRCEPVRTPADAPFRALEFELENHPGGGTDLRVNFDAHRFDETAVADLLDCLLRTLRLLTGDRTSLLSELAPL